MPLVLVDQKGKNRNGRSKRNFFQIFNNINVELHKQLNITDYFDWESFNKYCGKYLQYIDFM